MAPKRLQRRPIFRRRQQGLCTSDLVAQFAVDLPKMAPKCSQDVSTWPLRASKWPQDGPRMAQGGPKMAPGWPQDGPKMAQRCPKMAQDGPGGPKRAPRRPSEGPQKAPRRPQASPKQAPTRLQECPKSAPRVPPRVLQDGTMKVLNPETRNHMAAIHTLRTSSYVHPEKGVGGVGGSLLNPPTPLRCQSVLDSQQNPKPRS